MQYVCNNGVCVQLMCTASASTTLVSHLYPPVLLVVSRLAAAQVLVLVEPAVATEIVKQRPLSKPRRNRYVLYSNIMQLNAYFQRTPHFNFHMIGNIYSPKMKSLFLYFFVVDITLSSFP